MGHHHPQSLLWTFSNVLKWPEDRTSSIYFVDRPRLRDEQQAASGYPAHVTETGECQASVILICRGFDKLGPEAVEWRKTCLRLTTQN